MCDYVRVYAVTIYRARGICARNVVFAIMCACTRWSTYTQRHDMTKNVLQRVFSLQWVTENTFALDKARAAKNFYIYDFFPSRFQNFLGRFFLNSSLHGRVGRGFTTFLLLLQCYNHTTYVCTFSSRILNPQGILLYLLMIRYSCFAVLGFLGYCRPADREGIALQEL